MKGPLGLNHFMRTRQQRVGAGILVGLCVLGAALLAVLHHRQPPHKPHAALTLAPLEDQDFTRANTTSALERQQQQIDTLTTALHHLQAKADAEAKAKAAAEAKAKTDKLSAPPPNSVLDALKTRLSAPSHVTPPKKVLHAASTPVPPLSHSLLRGQGLTASGHAGAAPRPLDWGGAERPAAPLAMGTLTFRYATPAPKTPGRTAKNYVPAGTFARAILLEGADANASVNGATHTSPILLRLLSPGTLPNGHHSSLKGCFVLASIYGDISSERGEVRLQTLSCTRQNGQILDRPVKGYVSFSGKEGIKGHPVMRNGKIIAWAGASGLLSGIGQAVQQAQTTQSVSPLGVTQSIDPAKTLQYGAAAGFGTSMSKLSDYYIKRADQYHPIIEIGAGNLTTVVFQQGFSLNAAVNAATHQTAASPTSASSSSTMSAQQVLKAKIPPSVLAQISRANLGQTLHPLSANLETH